MSYLPILWTEYISDSQKSRLNYLIERWIELTSDEAILAVDAIHLTKRISHRYWCSLRSAICNAEIKARSGVTPPKLSKTKKPEPIKHVSDGIYSKHSVFFLNDRAYRSTSLG